MLDEVKSVSFSFVKVQRSGDVDLESETTDNQAASLQSLPSKKEHLKEIFQEEDYSMKSEKSRGERVVGASQTDSKLKASDEEHMGVVFVKNSLAKVLQRKGDDDEIRESVLTERPKKIMGTSMNILVKDWHNKYEDKIDVDYTVAVEHSFTFDSPDFCHCSEVTEESAYEDNSLPRSLMIYKCPLEIRQAEVYCYPSSSFTFTLCESLVTFEWTSQIAVISEESYSISSNALKEYYEWPEVFSELPRDGGLKSLALYRHNLSLKKPFVLSFPVINSSIVVQECLVSFENPLMCKSLVILEDFCSHDRYALSTFVESGVISTPRNYKFPITVKALTTFEYPLTIKRPLIHNFPRMCTYLFVSECPTSVADEIEYEGLFTETDLPVCEEHITIEFERPSTLESFKCGPINRARPLPTFKPLIYITKPMVLNFPCTSNELLIYESLISFEDGEFCKCTVATEEVSMLDSQLTTVYENREVECFGISSVPKLVRSLTTYECPVRMRKPFIYSYPSVSLEVVPVECTVLFDIIMAQEASLSFESVAFSSYEMVTVTDKGSFSSDSTFKFPVILKNLTVYSCPVKVEQPVIRNFPSHVWNWVTEECTSSFENPQPYETIVETESPSLFWNHVKSQYTSPSTFDSLPLKIFSPAVKSLTTYKCPVSIKKPFVLNYPDFTFDMNLSECLSNIEKPLVCQTVYVMEESHFCIPPIKVYYEEKTFENLEQTPRNMQFKVKALSNYKCPVKLYRPLVMNMSHDNCLITPLFCTVTFEKSVESAVLAIQDCIQSLENCIVTESAVVCEFPLLCENPLIYKFPRQVASFQSSECCLMMETSLQHDVAIVTNECDDPTFESVSTLYVESAANQRLSGEASLPTFMGPPGKQTLWDENYIPHSSRIRSGEDFSATCDRAKESSLKDVAVTLGASGNKVPTESEVDTVESEITKIVSCREEVCTAWAGT